LEWVCENISAFGGDPANITVGGQSGGSTKAGAMGFTPASNGRIRRTVLESGLKWTQKFPTIAEMEGRGREYLQAIGIDPEASPETLREMDPERLLPQKSGIADTPLPAAPGEMVWDGELIPYQHMRDNILQYMQGIDILCGTNLGEASISGSRGASALNSAEEFHSHYLGLLGELYDSYDFAGLVSVTDESATYTARVLASKGLCPAGGVNYSRNLMVDRLVGRLLKERYPCNQVYSYLFSHLLPWREEDLGTVRDPQNLMAYHSSELFYTFASLRENVPPARPWKRNDFELADCMSSYWANFMRTGDPNGSGLPVWPQSDGNCGYMEFGDVPLGHSGLDGKLEQLIAEYVGREYTVHAG
jgi:para-nitrobenzyl esterase